MKSPVHLLLLILMWMIWLSLLSTFPLYREFLSTQSVAKDTMTPVALFPVVMLLVPFTLCGLIRWLFIPRLKSSWALFASFVAGVSIAICLCFLGIFFYTEFETLFFAASVLAFAQFIPFFKNPTP